MFWLICSCFDWLNPGASLDVFGLGHHQRTLVSTLDGASFLNGHNQILIVFTKLSMGKSYAMLRNGYPLIIYNTTKPGESTLSLGRALFSRISFICRNTDIAPAKCLERMIKLSAIPSAVICE